MADPDFFRDADKVKGLNDEDAAAAAKLEIAFTEWSAVSEKIERYEEEFGAEA